LENLGLDEEVILQYMLQKYDIKAWSEFIWHGIETDGGLL
jgi:hypothetical protein